MIFDFDTRPSDSSFVEAIWRTRTDDGGSFTSLAATNWEMVITKQYDKTTLTVRGPETVASPAPIPENAEFFGIIFKLGTFMPHMPAQTLVNNEVNLPEACRQSFWLNCSTWQFPDFENADTFVNRLVQEGLLLCDPIVDAALKDQRADMSLRSVQRHFLQATGMTYKTIQQIERARQAATLLEQGIPILDAVHETGFYDQSHLTNALQRLMGQTPAQILRLNQSE
jgi:AraC-like DNA-binding protein